uniref:Uncharacterized protein n=1 Tax=Arundo donax TaxID=35708 RepID=A0A0A9VHK2_ARUDO
MNENLVLTPSSVLPFFFPKLLLLFPNYLFFSNFHSQIAVIPSPGTTSWHGHHNWYQIQLIPSAYRELPALILRHGSSEAWISASTTHIGNG